MRNERGKIKGAGLVAVVLVGMLRVDSNHWIPGPAPAWAAYATPVGNIGRITLQDGSSVDLNTNSEIKVRFTGQRREVVLVHGEALFNVVPHQDWLFEVTAGVVTVRSTGSRLSVRLREDNQTDVLVVEGGVGIDNAARAPLRVSRRDSSEKIQRGVWFFLTANARELISLNSTTVLTRAELTPAALTRRTAWTQGWLWFAKDPLPEALAQFNRYHPQQLVLVDPALASLEIGGRFRSTDLQSFLATLEHSFNVRSIPRTVHGAEVETIYLTRRCLRAQQQCNWSLVQ